MATTDVSPGAGSAVARALTFRDTRGALGYAVVAFLILGGLSAGAGFLDLQLGNALTWAMIAVVLFFFLNALIAVRESLIAVVGLLLVGFWILMAVSAPVLPLKDPNIQTLTFTSYVAKGGVDASALPPEAVEAQKKIDGFDQIAQAMGGELPPNLVEQRDAAQAVLDGFEVEPGATTFQVEYQDRTYWLSVDNKGRDLLSRIIWGSQRVLFWATLATVVAYVVGMAFGVAAGYLGGWTDEIISFVANVMLSFPVMVLYIIIIQALGQSGATIVVAVTFASAPGIMRIVRGLALDIRTRDYIAAAQTRGERPWYIMAVELLPNARGPLIVDACLRLGYTTIALATLGFLGLGLPPPDPSWGAMMAEARDLALGYPHMLVYPAIALSSLILGFNLLADGLRDISLRD